MEDIYIKILGIKNKQHLEILKKLSMYYKYGKEVGDKLLLSHDYEKLDYKDIEKFIEEYICCSELLINYFIKKGLSTKKEILEFSLSSLLSFQNTQMIPNITSIINYKTSTDVNFSYAIGTIRKNGINIYEDFDLDLEKYHIIINNAVLDSLINFLLGEDYNYSEYIIKYLENSNLDFFNGFVICENNKLKKYIIENFIRFIDNTKCPCSSSIEKIDGYIYGYIKTDK